MLNCKQFSVTFSTTSLKKAFEPLQHFNPEYLH